MIVTIEEHPRYPRKGSLHLVEKDTGVIIKRVECWVHQSASLEKAIKTLREHAWKTGLKLVDAKGTEIKRTEPVYLLLDGYESEQIREREDSWKPVMKAAFPNLEEG